MISANIPAALYPGLAYDGTITFAGVLRNPIFREKMPQGKM